MTNKEKVLKYLRLNMGDVFKIADATGLTTKQVKEIVKRTPELISDNYRGEYMLNTEHRLR